MIGLIYAVAQQEKQDKKEEQDRINAQRLKEKKANQEQDKINRAKTKKDINKKKSPKK